MLLPMLGDLLTREYQLQASVRDDVAFLKAELESMEATLLQISEAPADRPPDAQDSLWAQEIRELSYDVEDCVEAFLVRVHHHAPAPPGDRDLLQGLRGLINRGLGLLRRAKIRRDMGAAAASGRSERRRGWGMVRLDPSRPLSRHKHWVVAEVLRRAKVYVPPSATASGEHGTKSQQAGFGTKSST